MTLPQAVSARLISQVCDLTAVGDFAGAAELVAITPRDNPATAQDALLRAAVAPDPRLAVQELARGLDANPSDGRLLLALGSANAWLADRLNRQAFAVSCAAHLLQSLPPFQAKAAEGERSLDSLVERARAADAAGDWERAVAALRELQMLRLGDPNIGLNLGTILGEHGRYAEAIAVVEASQRLPGGRMPESDLALALIHERSGDAAGARKYWEALRDGATSSLRELAIERLGRQ